MAQIFTTLPVYGNTRLASLFFPSGRQFGIPQQSHPALVRGGQVRLSTVASPAGGMLDLTKISTKGTNTSTSAVIDGRIGPTIQYTGSSSRTSYSGKPSATESSITLAGIFQRTSRPSQNAVLVINTNSTTAGQGYCLLVSHQGNAGPSLCDGAIATFTSMGATYDPAIGVPYFLAVSTDKATATNFCLVNLATGKTNILSFAQVSNTAGNGTYQVGGISGFPSNGVLGGVACTMFSTAFLSTKDLAAWALDPWSFWYPQDDVQIILESLTAPSGALPPGKQVYDLPFTPPFRPQVSADQSMSIARQILIQPQGAQSYDLPPAWQVPFRPQFSADQGTDAKRYVLTKAPITGPTQDLPVQPFRPQVSGDVSTPSMRYALPVGAQVYDTPIPPFRPQVSADLGSTQRLATIKAPITGPTQDLPIPPFRPQFSYDQGQPQQLSSIKPPVTGLTQELAFIPPFRPQFSLDQGTDAKRYVLTYPPITGPTQDLPLQPWRPLFSYDQKSAAPYAFPVGAAFFDLPAQPYRPLVGFDQHGIITAVVQVPLNLYDWPLPLVAAQFNRSFDLGSTTWLNLGTKPFAQIDWPLPIQPFHPDFAFMPSAPLWLVPIVLPRNQYDWPLPLIAGQFNRSFDQGSTMWLNLGTKPFSQTDWPNPIQPFRPQFSADWAVPYILSTQYPPNPRFDWQNPLQPWRPQFSYDQGSTTWLNLGTKPFAQTEWPLTPPPFRPDASFMPPAPVWLGPGVVLPRNQYDWPLPISPARLQYGVTYSQQSFAPVPFNQFDWPVPAFWVPFRPQFSFEVNLALRLTQGQKPFKQDDWPVPAFWVPFRPQFSVDQGSTIRLNLGTKPFAQTDWPLPRDYPRLPPGFYQIGALNVGGMYPPGPAVKIEWLIRARRRGRR